MNPALPENGKSSATGKSVIVVDDDPAMRDLLKRQLSSLGYKVRCAENSKEVFTLAHEAGTLDLLIVDIFMPDMDGRDVARWMLAGYPKTKVLFISGAGQLSLSPAVLGRNAAFLHKPFTASQLEQHLASLLAN